MKKLFAILFFIIVFYTCYRLFNFQFFDDEVQQLERIEVLGEAFDLGIYQVPSNATVQGSIQIRKLYNDGVQETVGNYIRYNYMTHFELLENELLLVLQDTIRDQQDTVIYKIE